LETDAIALMERYPFAKRSGAKDIADSRKQLLKKIIHYSLFIINYSLLIKKTWQQ